MEQSSSDLKPARSQAELTRVRQGWVLVTFGALQLVGTAVLLYLNLT